MAKDPREPSDSSGSDRGTGRPTHNRRDSSHRTDRAGRFELFYRDGWAYLIVNGPNQSGIPVYPEEIESRMKMLGIPRVSYRRLQDLIEAASGEPEPLVEWPEGSRLASQISVVIPEDEMSAWVTVRPPRKGAAPPTAEEIASALQDRGVTYGIDRDAIDLLLQKREYEKPVPVAQGTEPVHAKGRRIEYHFMTDRGKPYLVMEFDRINLKELNFIDNREQGDLLATLLPPVVAQEGRTVTGKQLPAESAPPDEAIPAGQNTRFNEDRTELYAAIKGNVRFKSGRIIVEPVVTVRNVDYETGNIHFDGSVVVEGGVADGFTIRASGDIQVGMRVGKATLEAGGNMLLKGGINGNQDGTVHCGENFFAKYVESATIRCDGNAFVEEAILRSQLTANGHCVLNGHRAECIASEIIIGGSFWCKKLGNHLEAPTNVTLGVEPDLVLEYRKARTQLEEKQDQLNATEQKLTQIETAIEEGKEDPRLQQAQSQLRSTADTVTAELAQLRNRLPQLRDRLRATRRTMVVVEETMFKGATITFGALEYRAPENGTRATIFRPGKERVDEFGFNRRERPSLNFDELEEPDGAEHKRANAGESEID